MIVAETQVPEAVMESKKETEVETYVAEVHQMPLVAIESEVVDVVMEEIIVEETVETSNNLNLNFDTILDSSSPPNIQ